MDDYLRSLWKDHEEADSPYSKGFTAAAIPPSAGQPTNPYPDGTEDHDKWQEGYGDWADLMEWLEQQED